MINALSQQQKNAISKIYLGWGRGSESHDLYQVHLELVNQDVCNNLLNTDRSFFEPQVMICAGDVENGGRGTCSVSQ